MHFAAELNAAARVDDNWALFGDSVMAESYSIHSSRITFAQIKAWIDVKDYALILLEDACELKAALLILTDTFRLASASTMTAT